MAPLESNPGNPGVTIITPIHVEISSSNRTKNIFSRIKSAGLSAFEAGNTVLYTAKALGKRIPTIPERMTKNLEEIKASKPTETEPPVAKKRKSRKKSGNSSPSPKEIEEKTNKAREEGKKEAADEFQPLLQEEQNKRIAAEEEAKKAIKEKEELNQALQTERKERDDKRKEWEEEARRILESNKELFTTNQRLTGLLKELGIEPNASAEMIVSPIPLGPALPETRPARRLKIEGKNIPFWLTSAGVLLASTLAFVMITNYNADKNPQQTPPPPPSPTASPEANTNSNPKEIIIEADKLTINFE